MKLENSFLCIECDSIFSTEVDTSGEFGYLIERYKHQCPSCGSNVNIPLGEVVAPLSNRRPTYRDHVLR